MSSDPIFLEGVFEISDDFPKKGFVMSDDITNDRGGKY